MGATPVVSGIRVLTNAQIAKLSDHGLRDYRRTVLRQQALLHDALVKWCCSPKANQCDVVHKRNATTSEKTKIAIFDRLAARCAEERESRRFRRGAR